MSLTDGPDKSLNSVENKKLIKEHFFTGFMGIPVYITSSKYVC